MQITFVKVGGLTPRRRRSRTTRSSPGRVRGASARRPARAPRSHSTGAWPDRGFPPEGRHDYARGTADIEALRPRASADRGRLRRRASGEVVALAGENGSGKSTLAKILAGAVPADGGGLTIDGAPCRVREARTTRSGSASRSSTQEPTACPAMSVAENLLLKQAAGCALGLPASTLQRPRPAAPRGDRGRRRPVGAVLAR